MDLFIWSLTVYSPSTPLSEVPFSSYFISAHDANDFSFIPSLVTIVILFRKMWLTSLMRPKKTPTNFCWTNSVFDCICAYDMHEINTIQIPASCVSFDLRSQIIRSCVNKIVNKCSKNVIRDAFELSLKCLSSKVGSRHKTTFIVYSYIRLVPCGNGWHPADGTW